MDNLIKFGYEPSEIMEFEVQYRKEQCFDGEDDEQFLEFMEEATRDFTFDEEFDGDFEGWIEVFQWKCIGTNQSPYMMLYDKLSEWAVRFEDKFEEVLREYYSGDYYFYESAYEGFHESIQYYCDEMVGEDEILDILHLGATNIDWRGNSGYLNIGWDKNDAERSRNLIEKVTGRAGDSIFRCTYNREKKMMYIGHYHHDCPTGTSVSISSLRNSLIEAFSNNRQALIKAMAKEMRDDYTHCVYGWYGQDTFENVVLNLFECIQREYLDEEMITNILSTKI